MGGVLRILTIAALILPLCMDTLAISASIGMSMPARPRKGRATESPAAAMFAGTEGGDTKADVAGAEGGDSKADVAGTEARATGARLISDRWRVSLAMTAFETAMPLVGLAAGAGVASAIGSGARYFAAVVLFGAGAWFIWESLGDEDEEREVGRLGWAALAVLGVAVSMDELAVGFAGGLSGLPIVLLAILVGAQALVASQIGLRFGALISERYTELAERAGGVVLMGCAVLVALEKF